MDYRAFVAKFAAQDNDQERISATGESKGLSFADSGSRGGYATGPDAWASVSQYLKQPPVDEPDLSMGKHAMDEASGGIPAWAIPLILGGGGGLVGAAAAPSGRGLSGLFRGAGIGLGTALGAGLGTAGGAAFGAPLGGYLGHKFGHNKPLESMMDESGQIDRQALEAMVKDVGRGALYGGLGGGTLGGGLGTYGGYQGAKNLLWFNPEDYDDEEREKRSAENLSRLARLHARRDPEDIEDDANAPVVPSVFKTDGGSGGGDGPAVGFENRPQMGSGVKLAATSSYVSPSSYDEVKRDGTIYEDDEGEQSEERCEGIKVSNVVNPVNAVKDLAKTPLMEGFNPASPAQLNDASKGMQTMPTQFNPDNLNEMSGINTDNAVQTANTLIEPYPGGETDSGGKLLEGMDKLAVGAAPAVRWAGPKLRFLSDIALPGAASVGAGYGYHQAGVPLGAAIPFGLATGTIASPRSWMRQYALNQARRTQEASKLSLPAAGEIGGLPAFFEAAKPIVTQKAIIGGVGALPSLYTSLTAGSASTAEAMAKFNKAMESGGRVATGIGEAGSGAKAQAQTMADVWQKAKDWGPYVGYGAAGLGTLWALSKLKELFSKKKKKGPAPRTHQHPRRRRSPPRVMLSQPGQYTINYPGEYKSADDIGDLVSKSDAGYRPADDARTCGTCLHFSGNSCSKVAGEIAANFTSDYYTAAAPIKKLAVMAGGGVASGIVEGKQLIQPTQDSTGITHGSTDPDEVEDTEAQMWGGPSGGHIGGGGVRVASDLQAAGASSFAAGFVANCARAGWTPDQIKMAIDKLAHTYDDATIEELTLGLKKLAQAGAVEGAARDFFSHPGFDKTAFNFPGKQTIKAAPKQLFSWLSKGLRRKPGIDPAPGVPTPFSKYKTPPARPALDPMISSPPVGPATPVKPSPTLISQEAPMVGGELPALARAGGLKSQPGQVGAQRLPTVLGRAPAEAMGAQTMAAAPRTAKQIAGRAEQLAAGTERTVESWVQADTAQLVRSGMSEADAVAAAQLRYKLSGLKLQRAPAPSAPAQIATGLPRTPAHQARREQLATAREAVQAGTPAPTVAPRPRTEVGGVKPSARAKMRSEYRGGRPAPQQGPVTPEHTLPQQPLDVERGQLYSWLPGTFKRHATSSAVGGAGGGTYGYLTAPEGATTAEKIQRAGIGAGAGAVGMPYLMRGGREMAARARGLLPKQVREGAVGGLEGFGVGTAGELGARALDTEVDPALSSYTAAIGAMLRGFGKKKAQGAGAFRQALESISGRFTGPKGGAGTGRWRDLLTGGGAGQPRFGKTVPEGAARLAAVAAVPTAMGFSQMSEEAKQNALASTVMDQPLTIGDPTTPEGQAMNERARAESESEQFAATTHPVERQQKLIAAMDRRLTDAGLMGPGLARADMKQKQAVYAARLAHDMRESGFTQEDTTGKSIAELTRLQGKELNDAQNLAVRVRAAGLGRDLTPEETAEVKGTAMTAKILKLGQSTTAQKLVAAEGRRNLERVVRDPAKIERIIAMSDNAQVKTALAKAEKDAFTMGKTIDEIVDWFDKSSMPIFEMLGLGGMNKWHKILLAGGVLMAGIGGMMGSRLGMLAGGVTMLGGLAAHFLPGLFQSKAPATGTETFAPTETASAAVKAMSDEQIQEALTASGKLAPIAKAPPGTPSMLAPFWYMFDKAPLLQHAIAAAKPEQRENLAGNLYKILSQEGMMTPDKQLTVAGAREVMMRTPWQQILAQSKQPSTQPGTQPTTEPSVQTVQPGNLGKTLSGWGKSLSDWWGTKTTAPAGA